jgi:hypothetical protein
MEATTTEIILTGIALIALVLALYGFGRWIQARDKKRGNVMNNREKFFRRDTN